MNGEPVAKLQSYFAVPCPAVKIIAQQLGKQSVY
jgi:hypothetical protein